MSLIGFNKNKRGKIREEDIDMKRIFVFLLISLCVVVFLLYVGAQENVVETPAASKNVVAPIDELATRLNVTIIDGINDKLIKLENCAVQVRGSLLIAEDTYKYTNTFIEGDRYEIVINIKLKK